MKNGSEHHDTNEPFICPYNSESEKNNAKKTLSLPLELKKLNNINTQFNDSSFSMEQVFGGNGAKTQLITEFEYEDTKHHQWEPIDDSEDVVPQLESTEDLRYGNPDVDGYSLCDVNPSDSDDYYDPKLMNVKLKSSFTPLILNTSDQVELIGASDATITCVAKDKLCKTSNTMPKPHALYSLRTTPFGLRRFGRQGCGLNPILDIIRGTDNPLPGPFSGRYKKCK
jgi:hypothetical protein